MKVVLFSFLISMIYCLSLASEKAQRFYYSANQQILRVSNCSKAMDYKDFAGNIRFKSEFVVSLCKEKVTYNVELISPERGLSWSKEERMIEGSEEFNYVTQNIYKGIDELVDPLDQNQANRVFEECQKLQKSYSVEVFQFDDSPCHL
jgi:hypothetical protein